MSEVIVYLPMVHHVQDGEPPVFLAHDVYNALDEAGIKWVQETADQTTIRQLLAELERADARARVAEDGLRRKIAELTDECESLEQAARQWMNHTEAARKDNDMQAEVIEKLKAEILRLKYEGKA